MSTPRTALYAGTFERSMDAKKRVAVPSDWLDEKSGKQEFYALLHPSKEYVIVMPPEELEATGAKIEVGNLPEAKKRIMIRNLYAGAHKVITDTQGRILMPEDHCSKSGLKGSVVFVGGRTRFEVWDRELYDTKTAANEATYLEIAEDIGL